MQTELTVKRIRIKGGKWERRCCKQDPNFVSGINLTRGRGTGWTNASSGDEKIEMGRSASCWALYS